MFLLVGNGDQILSAENGKKIDKWPGYVCRFNRFVTGGYERYTGTKTDIWITRGEMKGAEGWFHTNPLKLYFINHACDGIEDFYDQHLYLKKPKSAIITREWIERQEEIYQYKNPSLGLLAALFILSLPRMYFRHGPPVTIWGFNFFKDFDKNEYFLDDIYKPEPHKSHAHDGRKEEKIFNQLINEGKVRWFE